MGNNLKYYRKKSGKTQTQLSEFLGMSLNAYGHYETGRRQITPDKLAKLADLYGVSVDDLIGRGEAENIGRQIQETPELVPEDEIMIPLVASLRCGPGTAGEPFAFIKDVPIPSSYVRRWGEGLKAIVAVGESMSPTIVPGDMLICRPGDAWESGNVVSVNADDSDMIKRIYRTADGGIDLRSDNPAFPTIHYTAEDLQQERIRVLGRVLIPIGKEL